MLPALLKENIKSISESELEDLYGNFLSENSNAGIGEFATQLFHNKQITNTEFKDIQAQEKIEYTSVVQVDDDNNNKLDSIIEKLKSVPQGEEYTIIESIDQGAMGEIMLARDNKLGRTVAYKKIHPPVAEYPTFLSRFIMEAQITAQLQHPSIVPVYALMVQGNEIGYAMKLIDGITLKDFIKETGEQYNKYGEPDEHHTLHARLDHFLKVCDAIHYAHRKGVVHRDLKPVNIMIGHYNEVYVMDWGIAKIVNVDEDTFSDKTERLGSNNNVEKDFEKTVVGQVMGTPAYMSPEQAEGQHDALDHRSDLYSLGLILFEIVTFHKAINGKTVDELLAKAVQGIIDPPPIYAKQADEQEQLMAIVKKATQYLPEERYTTVADFADDIRRFMHGEAIHARPEKLRHKFMRWVTHHRRATVNILVYTSISCFVLLSAFMYQHMQTMQKSHTEGQMTSHFLTTVASKSQYIDAEFLKYESILEGISSGATNLLSQGRSDDAPYFLDSSIADPEKGAPDFAYSKAYGYPISVNWHVYKLAPGVEEKEVEPLLRRLNPVRHTFKPFMLKSYKSDVQPGDDILAHQIIMDEGLPVVWSYIGLEQGILAEYPGKNGFPETYDSRELPWYRNTVKNSGINWLQPYINVGGRGLILPCTKALFDYEGNFIGVAGIELALDYIRKRLMPIYDVEGLQETYLLNDKAEIVVTSSGEIEVRGTEQPIEEQRNLKIFPDKNVVNNILKGRSGYHSYNIDGKEKLLAYYKLASIGWYFLAEVDSGKLLSTFEF